MWLASRGLATPVIIRHNLFPPHTIIPPYDSRAHYLSNLQTLTWKLTPMPKYNAMEEWRDKAPCILHVCTRQKWSDRTRKFTPGEMRPHIDLDVPDTRKIPAPVWNRTHVILSTASHFTHSADLANLSKPYNRLSHHFRSLVHVCLCFRSYENTFWSSFFLYKKDVRKTVCRSISSTPHATAEQSPTIPTLNNSLNMCDSGWDIVFDMPLNTVQWGRYI